MNRPRSSGFRSQAVHTSCHVQLLILLWHHFIHHCGLIDERRQDDRHLFYIVTLNAIKNIHVRVMCALVVLDLVLDKLKSRQADRVKTLMIRSARVGDRDRFCAHIELTVGVIPFRITKCLKPLPKYVPDVIVALLINTTDLAGTIIDIEIG